MLATIKTFANDLQHLIDEAVHESALMDCESTITKLFSSDAKKLLASLEENLPGEEVSLAEQFALSDDVLVLQHQCEELHANNMQLQRHVEEERQKTKELIHRFDVRDNVVTNLKKHTLREGAHVSSGGAANYAAVPFELLEAMEIELGYNTAQCKQKMDTQGRRHEMSINRQQAHFTRIIEAKEKETIQLQMQFRNTLKSVQGSHASSVDKLQRETERLQRELAEASAIAMQKAEERFEIRFAQETKTIKEQCQQEVRAANENAAVEKARADGLSSRVEEVEKERAALATRAEFLRKSLHHALSVEQPAAVQEARDKVEVNLSAANQASQVAEEHATSWMNKFLELETSSMEHAAKLKSEIASLQKELSTLKHDFSAKENQIRDISNARNQAQQTINDLKREMAEMKIELDMLRSQNSELVQEEWSKRYNEAEKEWSDKVDLLQTALDVAKAENKDLSEQLQALRKRYESLDEVLKATEKDMINLKLEKSHVDKEHQALHQTYGAVVKASADLQMEVNKLAGEVAVAESSLQQSRTDLAGVAQERDDLRNKLEKSQQLARSLSPDMSGDQPPPTRTPRAKRPSMQTRSAQATNLRRSQTVATVGAALSGKRKVSLSLEPTSASPLSSSNRRTSKKQGGRQPPHPDSSLGDIEQATSMSVLSPRSADLHNEDVTPPGMSPRSGDISPLMVEVSDRAVQCMLLVDDGAGSGRRRSRPTSAGHHLQASLPFLPSPEEDRLRNAFIRVELTEIRLQIASALIEEQQQRHAAYPAGAAARQGSSAPPPMPWNDQQLVEYAALPDFPTPEQVTEQNQTLQNELGRRQAILLAITGRSSGAGSSSTSNGKITSLRFKQPARPQSELDDEAYYQVFRQAMQSVTPRPQTATSGGGPSRAQTATPGLQYTSLLADHRPTPDDGVIRLPISNTMPAPHSMAIDGSGKEMLKASMRLGAGFKKDASPRPKSATARMRSATPTRSGASRPLTPRAPQQRSNRCGATQVDPVSYFNVRKRVVSASGTGDSQKFTGGVQGRAAGRTEADDESNKMVAAAEDPDEDDFIINDDEDDEAVGNTNEGGEADGGAPVAANLCVASYAKPTASSTAASSGPTTVPTAPTFKQVMRQRQEDRTKLQQSSSSRARPQSAKLARGGRYALGGAPPTSFDM